MLFHCHRGVEANFPGEKLGLVNRDQTKLVWDEHGGTFVLRVEGLEVVEIPAEGEAGIRLEVDLPEPADLAQQIEGFAGRHSLRLGQGMAVEELAEEAVLVACHIPGKQLFVYSEAPRLTLRRSGPQSMELRVAGGFKARRVPCQETDLVIHLEMGAMGRLLAGMLGWARKGA
ncbi:MAG: hypothetical protein NTW80_07410 [Deltaproteobacteria bacterium]|nr:hypothetical protein [Deltaproteobacteria bacterium]